MKTRCLPLAAALLLAASPFAATAQSSAPPPISAASVPPAAKPGPRLLTPAESRNSASPPGELRPERPVTPQISVPLDKTPPASVKSPSRALRRGNAASAAGGIDDAAARCEAQSDAQARAKCRDSRAREARRRPPG